LRNFEEALRQWPVDGGPESPQTKKVEALALNLDTSSLLSFLSSHFNPLRGHGSEGFIPFVEAGIFSSLCATKKWLASCYSCIFLSNI
jgi:hypothetical protein